MHSDDYQFNSSAIVNTEVLSPGTLEAVAQFKKDYGAATKLFPRVADMIDSVGHNNALITVAEFVDLLTHDEREFMQQVKLLTPHDPLGDCKRAEQAMALLSQYDFAVKVLADRARYFAADIPEAVGLNNPIILLTDVAAEQAAREPIPFPLDTSMPYSEDVVQLRLRAAWAKKFPQKMLTELLDSVGDALNDAHYPALLAEELMTWGERYVALDSFIETKFTDIVFNTSSEHADKGVLKNYFRAFPERAYYDHDIDMDYVIGKKTPGLDEIIYGRGYFAHLENIQKDLDLGPRDPQILPFENLLKVYFLANHAKSYEFLALGAEGSKRPDITVDNYTDLVKAQRHMLAHNMQGYISTLRERFSLLHQANDADLIGEEWDLMLREE